MALRNTDPDPLDPNDPRVAVEWTDQYGQKIRPGDLVVYNGYQCVRVGLVHCINLLRKDGTPFSHNKPTMTLQNLTRDVDADEWIPQLRRKWNGEEYEDIDVPATFNVRNPDTEVVKTTLPNFKNRPYVP